MKTRLLAGAFLAGVFAAGCAAVLGLDAGDPLDGLSEAGADGTTGSPDSASDAPVGFEGGTDGGCGADKKACNGCQALDNPAFGCSAPGCGSCATLLGNPSQVTSYGCGPGCTIGQCAVDFQNCDKDAANGCESNLKNDRNHCGGCARTCDAGEFCVTGACAADCGAPQKVCGTACVDPTNDPFNCKNCGTVCPGPPNGNGVPTCTATVCGYTCNGTFVKCSDGCYQTSSDPTHCGALCQNCNSTAPANGFASGCNGGACQYGCNSGFFLSGSVCVPIDAGSDGGGSCTPNAAGCFVGGSPCGGNSNVCCGCRCNPDNLCCLAPNADCNPAFPTACCSNDCMPMATPDGGAGGRCL